MTIPDPLVYASIIPICATVIKVGQWFVQDVVRQKKSNDRSNSAMDQRPIPHEMTIAEFRPIADLMTRELNGRYMQASEARDKFAALEMKIDTLVRELKEFIREEISGR